MVDPESPRTWTEEYVSTHYADCLLFLREINLMTARSIDEGRFFKALISLDEILDAFTVFKSSGRYGDVRRCLSIYSCAAAELTAFTDPEEMTREAVSYGIRPKTGLAAARENLLKTAVGGFLDARDFAASGEWRSCMNSVAKELKAGVPAGQVRLKYFQDFPDDIREDLLKIDGLFFAPRISQCAPDRCFRLDRSRLIFTRELDLPEKIPVDFTRGPDGGGTGGTGGARRKNRPDFDQWMAENDYDEEDLEWMCRRVRRRRNFYGVLMLFPPLGVVLLPFWLRAVYLTRAFSSRDYGVDFSWLHKLVMVIYGLPTVYIYPLVMGFIVRWSEWGMGLRTARARALSVIALVLAAVLGFRALGGLEAVRKLPGAAAALPGRVIALVRGSGGAEDPPPEEERGLVGGWYSVQLQGPPGFLEPDRMVFRYYRFREDGTCECAEHSYVRSDTGLSAFQAAWSLAEADETQGSYSFDGGEELWILTGTPGVTAEYELHYRCELGGGLLQLWDEEEKCRYCCYATDADAGDEEMLITGLSEQSRQLCGEWAAARRTADDTIETTSYIFLENGAFDLRPGVFTKRIHQPELTGWEQDWADDPAFTDGSCTGGSYTFDGTNLVLTVQWGQWAGTWEDWTETYAVGGDLTETLELDGVKYAVIDERLGDWEAVWDALGVDHSVD